MSKPVAAPPSGLAAALVGRAQARDCRCADTTEPPAMCCRRTAPAGDGSGPSAPSSPTGPAVGAAVTQPGVDLETHIWIWNDLIPTVPSQLCLDDAKQQRRSIVECNVQYVHLSWVKVQSIYNHRLANRETMKWHRGLKRGNQTCNIAASVRKLSLIQYLSPQHVRNLNFGPLNMRPHEKKSYLLTRERRSGQLKLRQLQQEPIWKASAVDD